MDSVAERVLGAREPAESIVFVVADRAGWIVRLAAQDRSAKAQMMTAAPQEIARELVRRLREEARVL